MYNTKKSPYPHNNYATTEDFLEEIALVLGDEKGKQPIPEIDEGYEILTVDDTGAVTLTVPENAVSADISIEADASSTNKSKVIRFKENGSDPSSSSGLPFGEGILKVIGTNNLNNFKIIGIEVGKNHTIQIQYYRTVQKI